MKILFFSKKLAGTLLMPLQFSLALIVIGAVLLWLNRSRRLGKYLVTAGAALLLIFSNKFVGYHLVHSLESEYPPLRLVQREGLGLSASALQPPGAQGKSNVPNAIPVRNPLIVVLSGGAANDPSLPMTDRLTSDSALRVVEAVEIYRSLDSSASSSTESVKPREGNGAISSAKPRILMSGGPTMNSQPEAIPMQKLAESLGVPASSILLEMHSDDTASEAKNVKPFVGRKPFILVTSAYHMPRSMALFRHLGMRPIPAPSNYAGRWTTMPFVLELLPDSEALLNSETAWHERLGMFWEHLRGQL